MAEIYVPSKLIGNVNAIRGNIICYYDILCSCTDTIISFSFRATMNQKKLDWKNQNPEAVRPGINLG